MQKISQRVRTLRTALGLTQAEMGSRLGVSANYVYLIESGRQAEVGTPILKNLEAMEAKNAGRVAEREKVFPIMEDAGLYRAGTPEPRKVPIISKTQAGQFVAWEELPPEHHEFLATDCPDPQAFALEVEGESMEPRFEAGDLVIVMPNFKPTNESLVVAKLVNGDVMFKQLLFLDTAGERFQLLSYNPRYPTLTVSVEELERLFPVYAVVRKVWSHDKWLAQNEAMRKRITE